MPAPIRVELLPYSSSWKVTAEKAIAQLFHALPDSIVGIHHIGSTAIPGIHAKPIIDLMPVVRNVNDLDQQHPIFLQLGYSGWGEYGIPGRRFFTFDEPITGRRLLQLHCFEVESHQIERHLACRDYLCGNPAKAEEYDREKHRCRDLHPHDSHAYSDAKHEWIAAQLPDALAYFRLAKSVDGLQVK